MADYRGPALFHVHGGQWEGNNSLTIHSVSLVNVVWNSQAAMTMNFYAVFYVAVSGEVVPFMACSLVTNNAR
jgi:hypothetical protein